MTRERILIVDDEPTNLTVLTKLLETHYQVLIAKNGTQALQRAMTEPMPDLIMLDIVMPALDGFAVCKHLQTNAPTSDIPVVFITSLKDVEDKVRAFTLGGSDYITRPFQREEVLARVRHHLALKRLNRELRQANAELQRLATTDPLTGVANRRRFFEDSEREVKRHRRREKRLSVIALDVDHFKAINDSFGHDVGDNALIQLTKNVGAMLRAEDLFARTGGEEFAIVLVDTPLAEALKVAERIRCVIAATRMATPRGELSFTISAGVAELNPGEDFQPVLKRADNALYQAKLAGRNCVK